jgi:hypothetical protein
MWVIIERKDWFKYHHNLVVTKPYLKLDVVMYLTMKGILW